MAFPTTSVRDNFNVGADATPPNGNWSLWTTSDLKALAASGQAESSTLGVAADYLNAATFGPDAEAGFTVAVLPLKANSERLFLAVRLLNPGNNATRTGYYFQYQALSGAGTDTWKLFRYNGDGTQTQLGATVTGHDLVAGNKIGLEAKGSAITVYRWDGTSWTAILSVTDATYSAAGYIGMGLERQTARADDFFGGTIAASGYPKLIGMWVG